MYCPFCQAETGVINSRPNSTGIRRRRKCPECGYRFSTQETIVPDPDQARPNDIDGEAFEGWLTVISTTLPRAVAANVNLRELRRCYEKGMRLEQAMEAAK